MGHLASKPIIGGEAHKELQLETLHLKKAAQVLRAINHDLRQNILRLMHQHEEITVTDIYQKLQLEQSVASQHLAILRKARVVSTKRQGKHVLYSVDYERLNETQQTAKALIN